MLALLPDYFASLFATFLVLAVSGVAVLLIALWLFDLFTVGKMKGDVVPGEVQIPTGDPLVGRTLCKRVKEPNVALAVVYGALVLGLSIIIGASILGVLVH